MEYANMMSVIEKTINSELEHARSKFPDMNSGHEGYAIILEEAEELQQEVDRFKTFNQGLWTSIKENNIYNQKENINSMMDTIKKVIKEAIQVGAMCKRYSEDIIDI